VAPFFRTDSHCIVVFFLYLLKIKNVRSKRICVIVAYGYHNPEATMSTNAIISQSNLDINKITFGDIRMNKAGGKSIPIKYNGQNLQIRLEKATYFQGVNVKETPNGTSYEMKLSLRNCDPYAKDRANADAGSIGTLYNFLLDLQEKVIQEAVKNSKKWFGKDRSEPLVRETMKLFLAPSVERVNGEWVPSGKYPPGLKMKVGVYDGRVAMDVADHTGKPIAVDVDNITEVFPKRVEASVAVTPSIYVTGTGFGVTWRVTFARVSPPQRMTAADVFKDEIEEESKNPPAAAGAYEYGTTETTEEEHQEEEVSVPFVETAPAPAPAPTAPKSRRRVAAPA